MNYVLYPESANTASSLGEAYYENSEFKKAVSFPERSLELNEEPKVIKDILEILYKQKKRVKIVDLPLQLTCRGRLFPKSLFP